MTDRLSTSKEIAQLLNVPESWVRENTRTGAIPHVQLGRYVRYDRDEVLGWVETLKAGGGPRFRRHHPSVTSADPASGRSNAGR